MRYASKAMQTAVIGLIATGAAMLTATQAVAADKPTIELGYVQTWPSSVGTTQLAATVIENELGYPVKMTTADPGLLYQGVKTGDLDAQLSAWLPSTHESYYEKAWADSITLGPNLIGTRAGLVVPEYVDIDKVSELADHADKFKSRIVGIGAGAGVMEDAREVIDKYNLDFELQASSTAGMAAALRRATQNDEWVVVTGWSPLWIWGKFDLKYLEDDRGIYEEAGYVSTLTSRELPGKAPEVFQFLRRFQISIQTLNNLTLAMEEGKSEQEAVNDWLDDNTATVNQWVAGIDRAGGN